jgi:hypothetical protein
VPQSLGLRSVPVTRILGSVGGGHLLRSDFHPRHPDAAEAYRCRRVSEATDAGVALPPVHLYKLGSGYYVYEGHHRVAAARDQGQLEMDADVVEFLPMGDAAAAQAFEARHNFELQTGLTGLEASDAGTYEAMLSQIDLYGRTRVNPGALSIAHSWVAEVYEPLRREVRKRGFARVFPGLRSADIVVRFLSWSNKAGGDASWDHFVASAARYPVHENTSGGVLR